MESILTREERVVFGLRALYSKFGYRPYRMSKFEEYDLYAGNRSFLPSGRVITFTDTNGRLMALKPDVTLSIAKNLGGGPDSTPEKLYYDESVYRAPDSGLGFQEITQAGLEYLGPVDGYVMGEVAMLAARSLGEISPDWVLDLSHMGYLCALVDELGLRGPERAELLRAVGSRSAQAMRAVCTVARRRSRRTGSSASWSFTARRRSCCRSCAPWRRRRRSWPQRTSWRTQCASSRASAASAA